MNAFYKNISFVLDILFFPVLYLVFVFVCNNVLSFFEFFIVYIFELYKLYVCIQQNRKKNSMLKSKLYDYSDDYDDDELFP